MVCESFYLVSGWHSRVQGANLDLARNDGP